MPGPVPRPAANAAKKPARSKKPAKVTAGQVIDALRRHYGAQRDGLGPEWAALDEYSLAPGGGRRRADLFVIRCWRSAPKRHERHAIEVKVSRSDLLNELKDPAKSAPFTSVAHRFYLAVPAGLIRPDDPIPDSWGIYELGARGGIRKTREAVRNDSPEDLSEAAVVEAFRRAARAEARIRGAAELNDPAARIAHLQRQVTSLERSAHTSRTAADRARTRLRTLLSAIAEAGGWLCVCGKETAWTGDFYSRGHVDGTRCEDGRYGYARIDYGSLAVRLGLAATSPGAAEPSPSAPPTPAEVLEHVRVAVHDVTDPAEALARIRGLLSVPTSATGAPAEGPLPDVEVTFLGPNGP